MLDVYIFLFVCGMTKQKTKAQIDRNCCTGGSESSFNTNDMMGFTGHHLTPVKSLAIAIKTESRNLM